MSANELVQELEHLGVRFWEESGKLHFRAPKGVLTEERRAALATQKEAVLEHLRACAAPIAPHPESRHEPFPLTDVQSAYLLGRRKGFLYGGVGCHAYGELALKQVDPQRLTAVWQYLIRRHDMLRAVILPDGSQQVLPDTPDYHIAIADLRGSGRETARRALDATRAEMDHRVYEPSVWPLFDLRLSLLDDQSLLHISIDFLIADYVSIFVLLDDLRQAYEHPGTELPELSLTFRDYLMDSRGQRSGVAYERARAYWLERIDDFASAPDLPVIEMPTGAHESIRFRRWEFVLDQSAWRHLAQQAKAHGLTASGVVLAAYAEVIGRWSRHQRFTLDLTLLNRPPLHPDMARIVGDFTSISLLEVDHRVTGSFAERARSLQEQLGQDLEHRLFSGVELIRELARRRGTREALMPVVYTSALGLSADGGGMPMGEFAGGISQTPQVWIDCQVMERGGQLSVNWDVREGVFPDGLVATMFASFETLVGRLAADAQAWNDPCPVPLPPAQAARRAAVNWTHAPLPEGTLVSDALAWAERDAQRPCVMTADGLHSYGEVFRHAGGVKAALEHAGVMPGEIVAVLAEKGPRQVVTVLGILLAGAAYLPIEVGEPPARRDEMLTSAGVRLALCDAPQELPLSIRQIALHQLAPSATLPRPAPVSVDQLAYVIYTSGSTGQPKGVMITHRSALNTIHDVNRRFRVSGEDRVLCVSSLAFDLSVYDIFGLLAVGGALVFPSAERRGDPSHWAEMVEKHSVTVWNSVPGLMGMLQDYLASRTEMELRSLRLSLLSGDWIPVELVERARARLPALELTALGGATEGSIWSIFFPLRELRADMPFVPYGRPLANQTMHVLNDALLPAPDGVTGEICIGGAGVAAGYLGDEARTAERFISGMSGEGRLYRTGDLGRYRPDGNIEILGREDAQVKIRGHRVELGEVEAALAAHPDVARAVATVTGTGAEHRRVLAFVEAAPATPQAAPDMIPKAEEAAAAFLKEERAEDYLEYARALDRAALASMIETFRRAGLFANGTAHTYDQIIAALAAAPRYQRLIRRWLRAAYEHGFLDCNEEGTAYRVTEAGRTLGTASEWQIVDHLARDYDSPALLNYFRASGENLLALIRGDRPALEMLYPQGRVDVSISLHEHSFFNRWANRVAAAMVEEAASALDSGSRLRVLEIGGGVGGTTASILDALRQPYEYWFTDVTQYFLNAAQERFGKSERLRFAPYDLSRHYREQGFTANSFDLIVAGDVLHVARNVPQALAEVRELLVPGGCLIAIEMTRDHYQIMTSLELLNVTDNEAAAYEDERAQRDETFYTRDEWLRLFEESEADVMGILPRTDHPFSEIGLCVMAARYKADRAVLRPDDLTEFLRARLPDYMLPAEIQILDRIPLTANGKVDRKRLSAWETRTSAPQARTNSFENDLTRRLAEIWGAVLGLPAVSRDLNFFAAGGDSLLAAQLAGRMIEELPEASSIFFDDLLRRVLEGPTLLELAEAVGGTFSEALPAQAEAEPGSLVSFGGAADQPVCVFIHDAMSTIPGEQSLTKVLAERFRLYEALIDPSVGPLPQLAARYCGLLREAKLSDAHLVGAGSGNLLAVELGRQMLESGNDPRSVTVMSLGEDAASGPELTTHALLYAGDLNLIRLAGDRSAEAFWRTVCLGDLRVMELTSTEPEPVARLILEASHR